MLPAGEGGWLLACVGLWGPLGVEQGPQEVAQTACPTHWPPEELPSPTTSGFVRDLRESPSSFCSPFSLVSPSTILLAEAGGTCGVLRGFLQVQMFGK